MKRLEKYLQTLSAANRYMKEAQDMMNRAEEEFLVAFDPINPEVRRDSLEDLYETCRSVDDFSRSDYFVCTALLLHSPGLPLRREDTSGPGEEHRRHPQDESEQCLYGS